MSAMASSSSSCRDSLDLRVEGMSFECKVYRDHSAAIGKQAFWEIRYLFDFLRLKNDT